MKTSVIGDTYGNEFDTVQSIAKNYGFDLFMYNYSTGRRVILGRSSEKNTKFHTDLHIQHVSKHFGTTKYDIINETLRTY